MKCESCGEEIEETFLDKIHGTIIKDADGQQHAVCSGCQRQYAKDELLERVA